MAVGIGVIFFLILRYFGLIAINIEKQTTLTEVVSKSTIKNIVDNLTWGMQAGKENVLDSKTSTEQYKLLHSTPGGVNLFLQTTMSLFVKPIDLHNVACFTCSAEQEIHDCQNNSQDVIQSCWRKKIGSAKTAAKLFENTAKPGCIKFAIFYGSKVFGKSLQHLSSNISKSILSIIRIYSFNLDVTKDILLWIF